MAVHTLDITAFRALFPEFTIALYPDVLLNAYWPIVTCAMDDADSCALNGDCLQTALYMLLAHVAYILRNTTDGNMPVGVATQAHVDKITVTYAAPPFKSGWQAWLSQTPYGLMLWALLQAKAVGGFIAGGRPELDAFRKVGGYFW